ncbi:J domain-containing protein [Hymenobacter cellulosivorans]|uniref:J domain-containing protein n=1 Tax=Hymenobacter cellulosivorans TaxID=2932249 RepID=A0ABY4FA17_9BACT|nr:J domain-containing protein [Hymenobacter cellulosivorans]UOQ53514.1 J domain-containing protein [Hymenobacter cellulosivorans]
MQNHYHTLGVDEQATPDDIRRAYRRLVLLTHPDRTTDPAAHGRFLLINEAYDVLSNPARRRGYDALLEASRSPPPPRPPAPAAGTYATRVTPPRRGRPAGYATQRPRAAPINFGVYQKPIRVWGKILLLLGLLVVVDYYGLRYTTTATFLSATIYDGGADTYVVRTSKGRFLTSGDYTSGKTDLAGSVQLRVSLLFRFIREARMLPAGPPLPVLFRHQALFAFTGLLVLAAGFTQGKLLGDAGRVNAAIFATSFALLVVVLILRV